LHFDEWLTIFTKNQLMKYLLSALLICSVAYLSSCNSKDDSAKMLYPVAGDTTTNGSTASMSYNTSSFNLYALSVNNSPLVAMSASIKAATDTTYNAQIVITDYTKTQFGLNLSCLNSSSSGTFYVVDNSSTFTDYTNAQNVTYQVAIGSTVTITQSSYPITGTYNLNLYRNHTAYTATGGFSIYY
jgi:hypothetical protein